MFKKQSPVRTKGKPKPRLIVDPNKRMLVRQLVFGIGMFLLVGVLVTAIWYGTRISGLTLVTISASGGVTIPASAVIEKATPVLSGNYLGIIPRRFAWWYPEVEMTAALNTIPRIKNPVINRVSGTELAVSYDEYIPYALWCVERDSPACLFIDSEGYAFGGSPRLQGGSFVRYRTLGVEPAIASSLAPVSDLQKMSQFIELLDTKLKFEVAAVEVDTAGDVFYILAEGGELKATLRDDAGVVFSNLETILLAKEFKHIKPGNFQYIDLRFGSKVFVQETDPELIAGTASTTEAVDETMTKKQIVPAVELPIH